MKRLLILTFILTGIVTIQAQELKCQVQVISRQIQTSDRSIFQEMQKTIYEFMNNTVFTNNVIKANERIDCSVVITLNKVTGSDTYESTIQITSTRPVYNSSYTTPIFNLLDKNFTFRFAPQDAIELNVNSYTSTLSSVLSYYAYLILAFDYDTFGKLSGSDFLEKASIITNNAQSDPSPGWRSFQNDGKNRGGLIEEIRTNVYEPLRNCYYIYHRLGLDLMTDKKETGRQNILEALKKLKQIRNKKPDSYLLQLFFETKVDEIVNIFSEATQPEKRRAFNLLIQLDPGRQDKYANIMKQTR